MNSDITRLTSYGLYTFDTTSHALKAEKVLKKSQARFILIPTLREISASCGLSIKFRLEDQAQLDQIFTNEQLHYDGLYHVEKENGRNLVQKLTIN
ncbi:MAG: DUF3343 domain-containing protein [Syntrophomonadaceae bacterium]